MSSGVVPKAFNVGGIRVHVFARPGVLPSPGDAPVAPANNSVSVLFALHGRLSNSKDERIVATAVESLEYVAAQEKETGEQGRELIVVTFVCSFYTHDPYLLGSRAEYVYRITAITENVRWTHSEMRAGARRRQTNTMKDMRASVIWHGVR